MQKTTESYENSFNHFHNIKYEANKTEQNQFYKNFRPLQFYIQGTQACITVTRVVLKREKRLIRSLVIQNLQFPYLFFHRPYDRCVWVRVQVRTSPRYLIFPSCQSSSPNAAVHVKIKFIKLFALFWVQSEVKE